MAIYQNAIRPDEIYHYGVKGMHWGVRRYQNYDGTLIHPKGEIKNKSVLGEDDGSKGSNLAKKAAIGTAKAIGKAAIKTGVTVGVAALGAKGAGTYLASPSGQAMMQGILENLLGASFNAVDSQTGGTLTATKNWIESNGKTPYSEVNKNGGSLSRALKNKANREQFKIERAKLNHKAKHMTDDELKNEIARAQKHIERKNLEKAYIQSYQQAFNKNYEDVQNQKEVESWVKKQAGSAVNSFTKKVIDKSTEAAAKSLVKYVTGQEIGDGKDKKDKSQNQNQNKSGGGKNTSADDIARIVAEAVKSAQGNTVNNNYNTTNHNNTYNQYSQSSNNQNTTKKDDYVDVTYKEYDSVYPLVTSNSGRKKKRRR